MAQKHLIIMHGRDIKPSLSGMRDLATTAIRIGLMRAGKAHLSEHLTDSVKISFAYFGDLSNRFLAEASKAVEAKLVDTNDSQFAYKPCFPIAELRGGFELTNSRKSFSKAEYKKVLDDADDMRLADDALDYLSAVSQTLTFGILNDWIVRSITTDMTAYFEQGFGSAIRNRLTEVLQPALERGDDVCLLTHSLGCMAAYDQMWKFVHTSEYSGFRDKQKSKVSVWITLGNPMGEPGIRVNLADGRETNPKDRYPIGQIAKWVNVSAEDDYISHVEDIRPMFREFAKRDTSVEITKPVRIYNCWTYRELKTNRLVSNPHDFYGYLMNDRTARQIADWMS
jgi:hypothetical protein